MNIRNLIFVILLLAPGLVVLVLHFSDKSIYTDTIASINDLLGITLLPSIGGLLFKNKTSFMLAFAISSSLIFTKSLFFEGAERIVFAGYVIFITLSIISCSIGCLIKYLYKRHLISHSSGTAQKRAAP
jgi:hypothetical protein